MPAIAPVSSAAPTDAAHDPESQLGFFGFTQDGSLVVNVHPDTTATSQTETIRVGYPDFRFGATAATEGGPKAKVRANIAAVRTLRDLQATGRMATGEDHAVLARYIGWGPLPSIFSPNHPEWGALGEELRGLLTPGEWRAAEASTPNANHTPGEVIRAVYRMLARLGIDGPTWDGLNALEPALGSGAFIGYGPAPESGVRWTGIELEPIAGAIARALYPTPDIRITGYEHAILPRDAFDLVIGNVPFGSYPVHDPVYNPRLFNIHDYFLLKSTALARPGGLLALITSRYTMDKADPTAREAIAERADLVAAIRLPETAFRGRAVQRVTTDLLILRRRGVAEPATGPNWLATVQVETPDGPTTVNEYFADRPEMMAGQLRLTGKNQYRSNEPTVVLPAGGSLTSEMERVTALLPEDVYQAGRSFPGVTFGDASAAAGLADGAYKVVRGRLRRWIEGRWVYHGLRHERDIYKVVSLCAIRDAQREVLRTQNQDAADDEQDAARAELNRAYDTFVRQYGPINLEIRKEDRNGKISIRRPNLEAFLDDPYVMNVAALEEYDANARTVQKAAIFARRVVRPLSTVDDADTAEDALLLTLDRTGRVDLPTIARLWGRTEEEAAAELEGRIFLNPVTAQWETDDEYLSGPVRQKLREAGKAAETDERFTINAHALGMVQPRDLQPSEIHIALGATWVDRRIVVDFIRALLGRVGEHAQVEVANVEKEALWAVRAPRSLRQSVVATKAWGTPRAHLFRLVEDLLNQKATVIYDIVKEGGEEKPVRNPEATLSAQEKGQEIADEFARWVWLDGDRAEYLIRRYNEVMNGTRLRDFDGSHLTFPGLSAALKLDAHQRNGAWQILSQGNAAMAHVVGAGKTFLAIVAGMKARQLGIASKVLHCTMNHMLEQYSREFLQAYPEARLLTAHVHDVSNRDKRRLFFARAASGEYDAIIVTHSAFEKIGMSPTFEMAYLQKEIAEFEELVREAIVEEGERSLTVKQLQVVLRQHEARLAGMTDRPGKDENLTFEELGVDQMFIDEIHLYKNAAVKTKIAGIPRPTKPSKRSGDLMMKCAYLHQIQGQRGIVGMTGTLISNTIAELHVHMRYLAPAILRRHGIEHFDAFAANFIKRSLVLEMSPDGGGFRTRERFYFTNVPELLGIIGQVVDIQLAESLYEPSAGEVDAAAADATEPAPDLAMPPSMTNGAWPSIRVRSRGRKKLLQLPRPKLHGGRPETISADPSAPLLAFTNTLVKRAERIRDPNVFVDPRVDNMLSVTNDGRKAALDMRLIFPGLPDHPGSKVNLLVGNVFRLWEQSRAERATQLIFCDLSRPRTDGRFSVYNDIRDKLLALGIPAAEIAFMQDATTPRQKAAVQAAVRAGHIRVILGSTSTMGTGTNFQDRVLAIHHLDAPWRPSDVEQRDGRGARRGNIWPSIHIFRYVTERSFDAYVWTLLHYKLEMINRVMMGDPSIRELADNDAVSLNYAEVKALASGNPLILRKANLDAELARMRRARAAFLDRQVRLRTDRADYPRRLTQAERALAAAKTDLKRREDTTGDAFRITVGDIEYTTRNEGGIALRKFVEEASHAARGREVIAVGTFAGFPLLASVHPKMQTSLILRGIRDYDDHVVLFQSPANLMQSLESIPSKLDGNVASYQDQVAYLRLQVQQLGDIEDLEYPHEAKLQELTAEAREIERSLRLDGSGGDHQDIGALPTADLNEVGEEEDGEDEIPIAA